MKSFYTLIAILSMASTMLPIHTSAQQKEVSGVYVGGHIRRERPKTISTLRESGFTYVILFNVHVEADGTLTTDGETICKDGVYVFDKQQPYYQQDIANLKTEPTSISRIDICIGGWGNTSYSNIKKLVETSGTGTGSILYRNFKALKEAVPEIDGVNNDDEHCYDLTTGARFHVMMYDLGYKTTLAPYMNKSYWQGLCNKIRASRPKAVDRVMIQCYDGGAGNNPSSWTFTGVSNRHAGRTNYQTNMETYIEQMQQWQESKGAVGGFVWVYNDETWNLNAWAAAMNRVFKAVEVPEDEVVVRCYSQVGYKGYCVGLPVGTYGKGDLAVYGLQGGDMESLEMVKEGYKVKLYRNPKCSGAFRPYTTSATRLPSTYLNYVNAISIEQIETGVDGVDADDPDIRVEGDLLLVDNARGEQIYIYSTTGRISMSKTADSNAVSVPMDRLPKGIYVVKVGERSLKVTR